MNRPVPINDWHMSGPFQYRGFRPPEYTEGAKMSQHRFGRAIDISVNGMFSDELANLIIERRLAAWPYITAIENPEHTPTWVHVDCRNSTAKDLLIVDPV